RLAPRRPGRPPMRQSERTSYVPPAIPGDGWGPRTCVRILEAQDTAGTCPVNPNGIRSPRAWPARHSPALRALEGRPTAAPAGRCDPRCPRRAASHGRSPKRPAPPLQAVPQPESRPAGEPGRDERLHARRLEVVEVVEREHAQRVVLGVARVLDVRAQRRAVAPAPVRPWGGQS